MEVVSGITGMGMGWEVLVSGGAYDGYSNSSPSHRRALAHLENIGFCGMCGCVVGEAHFTASSDLGIEWWKLVT